jgi:RNA polymerase sigma-B factor
VSLLETSRSTRRATARLHASLDRAVALRTVPTATSPAPPWTIAPPAWRPSVPLDIWCLHLAVHERADPAARAALVEEYRPNAIALAKRLHRDRESIEDLVQVALEALILAIDRFDPHRGMPFLGFATPTIVGTLKRHYRDRGWSIRVPRRVHELSSPLREATEMLHQDLGRPPQPEEVADLLGVPVGEVTEAIAATSARNLRSLDVGVDDAPIDPGWTEPGYGRVDEHDELRRAVGELPALEARVLDLYFTDGMTQAAIGRQLGCSQMHVSRIVSRALGRLRVVLDPPGVDVARSG